jgi:integrase
MSLAGRNTTSFLSANGQFLRNIITWGLAGTGLCVGELLQLQVGDLVLRERSGWVTVRKGKRLATAR